MSEQHLFAYKALTLSNPIFLPTAYSPALIYFGWETQTRIQRTITCSYQNTWPAEKQKEYNLRYHVGQSPDYMRKNVGRAPTAERAQEKRVGRLPTSERNRKIVMSDEVRRRIGKG